MTDSQHRRDMTELAALYAVGALGDDERRRFEQFLATAPAADREEVAALQDIARESALAGPAVTPPASLKERLMARIVLETQEREGENDFTFVRSESLTWQELGGGASMKLLFNDPAGSRVTMLLRLAPGGTIAAHRHVQVEELYVLEGSCIAAGQPLKAGDYHRAEATSTHPVTYSEAGCLALVITSSRNEPVR